MAHLRKRILGTCAAALMATEKRHHRRDAT